MKKSILLFSISLLFNTLSSSQWAKIAQMDENLEALFQLSSTTTIATGNNTKIYNLNSNTPSEITSQLYNFGFITSSLYINEEISYIGGGCYFAFDECPANTLHKTIDGGETWSQVFTDVTFTGTGNIFGIIPINEFELLLVSDFNKISKVNISNGEATPFLIPGTEEANNFIMGKVSQSGKWLVAASFYDMITQNTIIYYESNDEGITWEEIELDFVDNERVAFIDYLPNNNLALISNMGNVYTIVNGIINPVNIINEAYDQITAQYVINDNDWYVSSFDQESNQSRLHLSTDGGQSWIIENTLDEGLIVDLSFEDRNNGFLIFNKNEVYKRTGPNSIVKEIFLEFQVSPNPVSNYLQIELNTGIQINSIEIIDATGRQVRNFTRLESQLDVSDLASGFYQIIVISNSGNLIAQDTFIKQ